MRSSGPMLGSTTPRLWTRPLVSGPPGPCSCGCALTAKTSKGFSAIAFAEDVLGIKLIPWQRWLFIHALELRPDGGFRFRTVLILVARQNGKTTLVEVKNLWKMFVLKVQLVIGTAQILDYAEESWDKAVEICEGIPDLNAEIAHVDKTNGKKALKLTHGSRWKIAAASRRGGRSLSADDVNLDELREHQVWDSWAAVTKTTMARRNAQVYAFSNAGDDKSIVLNDLQKKARATVEHPEADPSLGHFEWSAPDDVKCTCGRPDDVHLDDCRLQDREVWAQANPSLGYMITEEALMSALATDPEPVFLTECLCQRVPNLAGTWQVIGESEWGAGLDEASGMVDPVALSLAVSWDRRFGAITAAGRRPDGLRHVEVVDHRTGTGWMVDRAVELVERHKPCVLVVPRGGPANSLTPDLRAALVNEDGTPMVEIVEVSYADSAQAFGGFYDAVAGEDVTARDLRHRAEPALTLALAAATKRPQGAGHVWDWKTDAADMAPLEGSTHALWGHATYGHQQGPVELEGSLMA